MKKLFIIFSLMVLSLPSFTQDTVKPNVNNGKPVITNDSTNKTPNKNVLPDTAVTAKKIKKNTPKTQPDSLQKDSAVIPIYYTANKNKNWKQDTAFLKLMRFSGFRDNSPVLSVAGSKRIFRSTDHLFYILSGLVLVLALLKVSFPKYFQNIFSLSFQVKFRQTQTRELLVQNRFPAFMLNIYFIFSAGLFITLLAQYFNWVELDFWWLFLYVTLLLAVIYITKYLFINFSGWIFKAEHPAASYNFIVFLINKVLGIILIPCTVLFAFADDEVKKIVLTVTACIVFSMLMFRYIVSMLTVKRNLNISAFHFFIYLCAVEILPMLIIYKVLFLETSLK